MSAITGGCLCGNVRFTCGETLGVAGYCHCSDCRRCSGSAFGVSVGVARRHFRVTSGMVKGFTKTGDSGNELTRHFCENCGSPLYTSSQRHPERVYVKAGAFDDPAVVRPDYQSWTGASVPWAMIAAGLKSYETSRG